jgi:endonuclease/exonuclease/phosphatase family metal-dependent hydrolase
MTPGPPGVLRVLSYNVHRWGDDRTALARVVKACAPDVMLVQEAPTWWGTRRKRHAMAASFGLRYVVGSARTALLVADGINVTEVRHWRIWRPFFRRRLNFIATQLPGGAVGCHVTGRLAVIGCHLGLNTQGRLYELDQILRACRSFGRPFLLVGDLNEDPDGPVWARLAAAGLVDLGATAGPTFHSINPNRRIDGAHLSPELTGRLLPLPATPADLGAASDHLPLLIELS